MKKLNVITIFSGYDSQCLALERLGVPYELVAWCEIDRAAIKAHDALFPRWADRNRGDVSKVVWSEIGEQIDLLTYSSPCQDFSQAGKQRGGAKGSGTRSGLLWECERAIGVLKPRYLLFENVPALVSEKFRDTFLAWGKALEIMGYRNYWRCLNAKHYGVPQNRNRIFMVSIYGEGKPYYFPKRFKLEKKLIDVLETEVSERYYLSEERVKGLLLNTRNERVLDGAMSVAKNGMVERILLNGDSEGNASTITTGHDCARHITEPTGGHRQMGVMEIHSEMLGWTRDEKGKVTARHSVEVANCVTSERASNTQNYVREVAMLSQVRTEEMKEARRHHRGDRGLKWGRKELMPREDGLSNTLTSNIAKDNLLLIRQATKEGYVEVPDGAVFDGAYPTSMTRRGRLQDGGTVAPTVTAESNGLMLYRTLRIRRLTERELFRLMDVDDKDIDKLLAAGIPKTQLAKMAGNSIVVNVLYHIFRTLLTGEQPAPQTQLLLF